MTSFICCPSESFRSIISHHTILKIICILRCITLKPGDVILTGTPSGVGMHRKPAEFLAVGDLIESEIESIGKISNKVIADTP